MEEIWKDIEGYEGCYQISTMGRIKSIDRYVPRKNGKLQHVYGRIMIPFDNGRGYKQVYLSKNGISKVHYVHRLVAVHFIENPNNFLEINHKDEDKANNCVDNLEWCTHKYNVNYGTASIRTAIKQSKKVYQYDMEGNLLEIFPSCISVQRKLGYKQGTISSCCLGVIKSHKGFIFKYENDVVKHKKISKKD